MEKKNLLKEFSEFREKLEKFLSVPRNRLLGAVIFAALILLIVFGLTGTEPANDNVTDVKPPVVNSNVVAGENKSSIQDLKKNDKNVVRNPFAIPSAYHKIENPNGSIATNAQGDAMPFGATKKAEPTKPKLTGVVGGDGKLFAILEYNGESRNCQIGEGIGPYRVVDVGYNTASLAGPEDSILLRVGR